MKPNNISSIMKKSVAIAAVMTAMLGTAVSCTDESEYIYPNELHTFGPCPVLRGETIEIIGTGMNGLSKVIFPENVEVTDFVSKNDSKVVVTVPQEALPGHLILIVNGKEIKTRSTITYAEPITIDAISVPGSVLNAGDVVTVTGDYVYNIASVTFGNNATVEAEDFISQSRKELKVAVPAEAKTGKIVFSDGNEWEETSETVYTVSTATATSLSKSDLDGGESVTITGEHLNLVKTVYFPGDIEAEFTTAADGRSLTTTVPATTCSGPITLELFSLDKISTPSFNFPTVTITDINPKENVTAGMELTVTGMLLDRVTEIRFPGGETAKTGWSVSADGKTLKVKASPNMVDGKLEFVQNVNIIVESPSVSMKKEGNTFWVGNVNLGGWAQNLEVASEKADEVWAAFSAAITGPGQLTIEFEEDSTQGWWQIQPRYRKDWSTCFVNVRDDNGGIHNMEPGQTSWTINLAQEDIDEMYGAGWAFSGCNLTIKSMAFSPSK